MIDQHTQRATFTEAVDALGGQRAAAQALGCGERTIRYLLSGEKPLHDGWLKDMAEALIRHADHCKALEKRISPAFARNLLPDQPRADGRYRRED